MFIKLNFSTAQTSNVFLEALYLIMSTRTTYTSSVGKTNIATLLANNLSSSINSTTKDAIRNTLDSNNSEIFNTSISGSWPLVHFYYNSSTPALTFRFKIADVVSSNVYSYTQITPTTFTHSGASTAGAALSTDTYVTDAALTLTSAASSQTWSVSSAYCYWAQITPTAIIWAASNPASKTATGWNMVSGPWTNTIQAGPYISSQYTRLDIWNNNTNGIIPTCWTNGYDPSGVAPGNRPFCGISYAADIGWGNAVNNFKFNPKFSGTSNTTFSVMNTVDATPNLTGVWSVTSGYGQKVSFGTNIRNFQDQTSLASTTNATSGSGLSATTFHTSVYTTFNKTVSTDSVPRSAWHGVQGASLYPTSVVPPTIGSSPGTAPPTSYYRWPSAETSPKGTFSLQPLVWNRADYNNIGGLITDKAGVYLFNGDYIPGDEFTVSNTVYSIWPLADGFSNRIGLAVPKR